MNKNNLNCTLSSPPALMTTAQAAAFLGVCQTSVYRYISSGSIRAHRVGGRWRIVTEELIEAVSMGRIK